MIKELDASDWEREVTHGEGLIAVEFWHQQCIWCKKLAPVYEELSGEYADMTLARFDILKNGENGKVGERLGIMGTPTIKVFCNGREVGEVVGYMVKDELKRQLDAIKNNSSSCVSQSTTLK